METPELPAEESTTQDTAKEKSCRLNGQIPSSDVLANTSVRRAATGDSGWGYREMSEWLYNWFDRFNEFFFQGQLPQAVISFERTRRDVLGHFVAGRNDQGILYNINVNKARLARSGAALLETTLHEMLHLDQFMSGTAGKGRYHNRQFVDKAASFGLHVRLGKGCHDGPAGDPFLSLLRKYGVVGEARELGLAGSAPGARPERQRLRRWACQCQAAWAGGPIKSWVCEDCGQRIQLSPTKGRMS